MEESTYQALREHVEAAEAKHPKFCGARAIHGEYSDFKDAFLTGGYPEIRKECLHLAVVALRMYEFIK